MTESQLRKTFQDPYEVCCELITVLSAEDEEFQKTNRFVEFQNEIHQLRDEQEQHFKTDVEELTKKCDDQLKDLQMETKKGDSEELQNAQYDLKSAIEKKEEISSQAQIIQDKLADQEELKDKLEQQKQQIEHKNNRSLPSHKHDLNLYKYISCIKWQEDAAPHEVKGYISTKNKVKTFALDSQKNSQFFMTNYLWDQMDTDW